jgi:ATP-dependent DNA ligase
MNRLAALIDRLANADDEAKHRLLAHYFAHVADADRLAAAEILSGTLKPRRATLALVRGLAEERLDPFLFALSRDYVGDTAETIALTWPAERGANRDPSPGEIVDALGALGRSELPKRIAVWLDASDEAGRWAIIKLVTGTLPSTVTAEQVDRALASAGIEANAAAPADPAPIEQDDMFDAPAGDNPTPGEIDVVLMYVERGRARTSPTLCTFGLWNGGTIVPVGKAELTLTGDEAQRFDDFVRANTVSRFGPVLDLMRSADDGLVFEVTFDGVKRSTRHKSGLTLDAPRITHMWWDKRPDQAGTIDALERRLSIG